MTARLVRDSPAIQVKSVRIDSSARRSISRAPVGPPARPVAITGRSEQLQRAGDVDALAAGDGARLDGAVAVALAEVRDGDGAVDRGVEGDGEDHPCPPPAPAARASCASSPRASCVSPPGFAVGAPAAGPSLGRGGDLLGLVPAAPSSHQQQPYNYHDRPQSKENERILDGRRPPCRGGRRLHRAAATSGAGARDPPSTVTTTRPSASPARPRRSTSSGASTCVSTALAPAHETGSARCATSARWSSR